MGRVIDHESFIVRIKQLICRELPLENAPDLRWGKKYSSMIRALCYRGYNSLVAHWKLRHFSFLDPFDDRADHAAIIRRGKNITYRH